MNNSGITGAAYAGRWAILVAACAAPCATAAVDAADSARILYFETLRPVFATSPGSHKAGPASGRQLQFDAYGRRFELTLEANTALLTQAQAKLAAAPSALQLYRGRIEGAAGSWVRLATKGDEMRGMIWDGAHLYVVEPAAGIADSAAEAPAQATGSVIFRLEDVLIDSAAAACAIESTGEMQRGDAAFGSLVKELKGSPTVMQAAGAMRVLSVSALGDASFLQKYPNAQAAHEAILTRLNNVDGIYSAQLGIEIRVGALAVHDATSDPLSGVTASNSLLKELSQLRKRSPELNAHGLTHLFTGRSLDGTTIGIGYLDSVCSPEYATGLTESRNPWLDSLVAAHEIGHNFGADHDGDSGGSCARAPASGYLMASVVTGTKTFSQCSLERMASRVRTSACITSLPPANVTVPASLGNLQHVVSKSFEWSLPVSNVGGVSARNVRAELAVPASLTIESAYVEGGSCTSGGGVVACYPDDIPGGTVRDIHLTLRSDAMGASSISAQVTADNDATLTDNSGTGSIAIAPEADLAVSLAGPASGITSQTFSVAFEATNHTNSTAGDVTIAIDVPAGAAVHGASIGQGVCAVGTGTVRCTVASLGVGAKASGTVSVATASPGDLALRASVSGAYVDPNAANDSANLTVSVTGVAAPAAAAAGEKVTSSNGGGGSFTWLLLALTGLRYARSAARPRRLATR